MPFPPLDEHGQLPKGVYISSLDEIHDTFVVNAQRAMLWNGVIGFLEWVRTHDMAYPIYMAGGFISAKDHPNDIDIVHDLTHACDYNQFRGLQWFSNHRERIRSIHHVDYTANLKGNSDFSGLFQYLGPKVAALTGLDEKHPRGILRIESRAWLDGLNN